VVHRTYTIGSRVFLNHETLRCIRLLSFLFSQFNCPMWILEPGARQQRRMLVENRIRPTAPPGREKRWCNLKSNVQARTAAHSPGRMRPLILRHLSICQILSFLVSVVYQ
jgi:hypothetical protein